MPPGGVRSFGPTPRFCLSWVVSFGRICVLQRIGTAALGLLGLVVVALGVASATVWRADDTLVASLAGAGDATLVVTAPGVLELGGDPVTVTARVPDDGTVVLAVGRDTDVAGWVGEDAHVRVTGMTGWHELQAEQVSAGATDDPSASPSASPSATAPADDATEPAEEAEGDEAAAPAADPAGSDMWLDESSGSGSTTLTWPDRPGRWSLLVASTGEGAVAPTLELAWPRTVTTPWLWPCVVVGTLLVAAAVLLEILRRRRARRGDAELWEPVLTSPTPVVAPAPGAPAGLAHSGTDAPTVPLTRRQLREAALAEAAAGPRLSRRRDGGPATGAVPATSAPTSPSVGVPVVGDGSATTPPVPGSVAAGAWAVPAPAADAARPVDAGVATSRPGPASVGVPDVPGHAPGAGARADAWRRAWGFPATPADGPAATPDDAAPGPDAGHPDAPDAPPPSDRRSRRGNLR